VLQVNPTAPPQRIEADTTRIIVYEYDKENSDFSEIEKPEDASVHLTTNKNSWINIDGLRKPDVERVCSDFGIHQLIAEDILSIGQRPKMDEIGGVLYCLLYMLYFNEKTSEVETEQISIVLGKGFLISFQEDASRDAFDGLREKLKINNSKVRQNDVDFLLYSLLDCIVDRYFNVMERMGNCLEDLEEDIIRRSDKRTLVKINRMRKEMIVLKRNVSPVRDLINNILRSENPMINERTVKYFKDIYDHILQASDLAENYRDMMMNLQDIYLGQVNLRLNEVMKVMAVVTCLLAPATVIGGIFGMNFDKIPLLHNEWGFFVSVALMLIIPLWMILLFRRRGWF
jgi:magnesium transporter